MFDHSVRTFTFALLFGVGAGAQSNAIPGVDIGLYELSGITSEYRRGAAHPNGEIGVVIGHSFCNRGTQNVVWEDRNPDGTMTDTYPKIAFLLARDTGVRMQQVSGRSFVKHSGFPFNSHGGPCAPCTIGTEPRLYVGCSDTYAPAQNGFRATLGPTTEINPWLGTFEPIGSYFDRGDPSVGGADAMDGIKSLTTAQTNAFDPVKNRMEIDEQQLVASGEFWAQAQLVIQGEPAANRQDNLLSQRATFEWNGTEWVAALRGVPGSGSVLTRWSGARISERGNGNDDGRFIIATKVTGPLAGMYHYEFAIHNVDNFRAGATLRIPIANGATVANIGFRDVDDDANNDWTASQSSSEIVFSASASNALEWNTIYNFWFDCSVAPSFGRVTVDQAQPGPGSSSLAFDSRVPSGIESADALSRGTGCGECPRAFYEMFPSGLAFDLSDSSIALIPNGEGGYTVGPSSVSYVFPSQNNLDLGVDEEATVPLPFSLPYPGGSTSSLVVCSNGFISPGSGNGTSGFAIVSNFLYGGPRWAACWNNYDPPASGRIAVDSSSIEVRVSFRNLVPTFGSGLDNFQYVFRPDGSVHFVYRAMTAHGFGKLVGWSPGNSQNPGESDLSDLGSSSFDVCGAERAPLTLEADARPVLGASVRLRASNIPVGAARAVVTLSFTEFDPGLDLAIIGMRGCTLYGAGDGPVWSVDSPTATVDIPFQVPLDPTLSGASVIGQSFMIGTQLNDLGVLTSNGVVLEFGN